MSEAEDHLRSFERATREILLVPQGFVDSASQIGRAPRDRTVWVRRRDQREAVVLYVADARHGMQPLVAYRFLTAAPTRGNGKMRPRVNQANMLLRDFLRGFSPTQREL